MSKLNKSTASKIARQNAQYYNSVVIDGRYVSHYDQGYQAYFNRTKYGKAWHPHKQQGWRAARDSDMLLLKQVHKPEVVKQVLARLNEMLELHSVTVGVAA